MRNSIRSPEVLIEMPVPDSSMDEARDLLTRFAYVVRRAEDRLEDT